MVLIFVIFGPYLVLKIIRTWSGNTEVYLHLIYYMLRSCVFQKYLGILVLLQDNQNIWQGRSSGNIPMGLAVGIALVMYGRLQEADPLIVSLTGDKDAILRRSGQ